MSGDRLVRQDVATSLGLVPVWSRPGALDATRPLVLAVAGTFVGPDDLAGLPGFVEPVADAALVRIPGAGAPPLREPTLSGFARALGEVVERLGAGRPVVLLGVSLGASVALGVRAGPVRRIVAAEPILSTAELWPLVAALPARLRAEPAGEAFHEVCWRHLGVDLDRTEPRDHWGLLEGLAVHVDVLLAGQPLLPQRRLAPDGAAGFPSLVSPADRARLAAMPQVRLHLAPQAGHEVQASAARQLRAILFEACRRASADPPFDRRGLDEALVEAVPLSARRVAHWGPGGRAFAGTYLAWNPNAAVELLGEAPDAAAPEAAEFDAIVLGAPPPAPLLARLAAVLRAGGDLAARWTSVQAAPAEVREALAGHGLALAPPVDAAGTGVLRARKAAGLAPPMRLEMVVFADRLMDVRTRLPVRGLRADPELVVESFTPPHTPAPAHPDAPKAVVLQRQAPSTPAAALGQLAFAIARGWLLILEFDDHPDLVAEATGRPLEAIDSDRFAYAHAVQTSTEALAELFRRRNPEVQVFENAVFELAPFPRGAPPRRAFYGAAARGAYGVAVARSLAPVTAAFPDLEFVVVGDRAVFDALPTQNKVYEDYLAYEAYLARMAGCAVSLSPIEPSPAHEAKSDAKFLDAARAGVLTIGSPAIYGRTIEHGVNGLLAPRLEDWAPLLQAALADPAAARAMGRRAWDYVRTRRMFADQAARRRDWCRGLWDRREALERALVERLPGLAAALAAERAGLAGG